jgi:hypothetical protein
MLSGKIFRCLKEPHPERPSEHYFRRDKRLEEVRDAEKLNRRRGLVTVPGERR